MVIASPVVTPGWSRVSWALPCHPSTSKWEQYISGVLHFTAPHSFSCSHTNWYFLPFVCWAISASLEENIIYDSNNNDFYLGSAEQLSVLENPHYGRKFGSSRWISWQMASALVIPGVQILSSQTILHPFPPLQLSEVTTQYYQELSHNTRTLTVRSLLIVNIMGHILESVSQSHESQRIIKSFIRQWQEFVRFKDFSVTNSSQDSHRQFRMKSDRRSKPRLHSLCPLSCHRCPNSL